MLAQGAVLSAAILKEKAFYPQKLIFRRKKQHGRFLYSFLTLKQGRAKGEGGAPRPPLPTPAVQWKDGGLTEETLSRAGFSLPAAPRTRHCIGLLSLDLHCR